jgi:hypothetical protein
MPIILNLTTGEYFISNDEAEQTIYLKKLLNYKPPTLSLDWKCISTTYTSFKNVIRWKRIDKIIIVPSNIETYILNNRKYQHISINYSGNVVF